MSRLTELLRHARSVDPQLGADLEAELGASAQRRTFGLVFERHQPEAVDLPGRTVRRGDKVRVLLQRGEKGEVDQRLWRVVRIERTLDNRVAHLEEADATEPESCVVAIDDLVAVAEFRDHIYPGLIETGRVERGGDKPFHTIMNSENYHALEMLSYTHRHSVDAIFIDPPYNSGAKDWKYNNDYVESDDEYRHSKWLAFIERRLKIARELLNPNKAVLVVTIDEKEYLRLGLLLEQMFPGSDIQMVSSVTNRAGSARAGRFARVDEYLFFVFIGAGSITPWVATMLGEDGGVEEVAATMPTVWFTAVRRGTASAERSARAGLFYPVIIDKTTGTLIGVGDSIPKDADREDYEPEPGTIALWPLAKNGREQTWRFSASRMRQYFEAGTARLGKRDPETGARPITYLQPGTLKNIANGTFVVTGKTPEGALQLALAEGAEKVVAPRTVWNRAGHFARDHGSTLLNSMLGEKRFDFPKSLYAVEDAIRFAVGDKPDALILDFFAGSGTTAHAVMRLNKQDGGRRQSISITNNEVSADEQEQLSARGLRPGDSAWEELGICDYVTKPRITAAITGLTPAGDPIEGEYKFTDEFPMDEGFEENAAFFTLTYESPLAVRHHRAFARIAPMLWLRAGSEGRIITSLQERGWDTSTAYGVLSNLDAMEEFAKAVRASKSLRLAFIVTDDEGAFQMVCRDLPNRVTAVRLYESYLLNFEISTGRSL